MNENEYRIYMVNLPGDIHGAVRVDQDGFASIYINDQLSPKARIAAIKHELRHLRQNDHYNLRKIREVERR
jgi:hypothetical protein